MTNVTNDSKCWPLIRPTKECADATGLPGQFVGKRRESQPVSFCEVKGLREQCGKFSRKACGGFGVKSAISLKNAKALISPASSRFRYPAEFTASVDQRFD